MSVTALLLLCGAQAGFEAEYPALAPTRLRADVRFLASDELRGRRAGSPGARVAARWIAARFAQAGLQPLPALARRAGDADSARDGDPGSWMQPFPLHPLRLDAAGCRLRIGERDFELGRDFLPHPGAPAGGAAGEIVFGGYGLTLPEIGYDDLEGLDLTGRIVVLLRWEPQLEDEESVFAGEWLLAESALAAKVRRCEERGAAAVLIGEAPGLFEDTECPGDPYWPSTSRLYNALVPMVKAQADAEELAATNFTPEDAAEMLYAQLQMHAPLSTTVPVCFVSAGVVDAVVKLAGGSASAWFRQAEQDPRRARGFRTGRQARLAVAHEPQPESTGWNVIGMLPGGDEALRDEIVVVGAHYDHVGDAEDGTIWNGADDNASGTVAMIALAESLARGPAPPRTVVFVAFSGEERGLLGAAWMLAGALLDETRITAMLNLDMVGRAVEGRVMVAGTDSSPALGQMVRRAAEGLTLTPDLEAEEMFDRSDQAVFYYQRIPVVFFNTAEHEDYHRPTDTWDRVHYDAMSDVAVLARRTLAGLAEMDPRPEFVDAYGRLDARAGRSPTLTVPWPVRFRDRLDY